MHDEYQVRNLRDHVIAFISPFRYQFHSFMRISLFYSSILQKCFAKILEWVILYKRSPHFRIFTSLIKFYLFLFFWFTVKWDKYWAKPSLSRRQFKHILINKMYRNGEFPKNLEMFEKERKKKQALKDLLTNKLWSCDFLKCLLPFVVFAMVISI